MGMEGDFLIALVFSALSLIHAGVIEDHSLVKAFAEHFLSTHSGYRVVSTLPEITRINVEQMRDLASHGQTHGAFRAPPGLYIPLAPHADRLYLLNTTNMNKVCDQSIVLHELVHYFQYKRLPFLPQYAQFVSELASVEDASLSPTYQKKFREFEDEAYQIQTYWLHMSGARVFLRNTAQGPQLQCVDSDHSV